MPDLEFKKDQRRDHCYICGFNQPIDELYVAFKKIKNTKVSDKQVILFGCFSCLNRRKEMHGLDAEDYRRVLADKCICCGASEKLFLHRCATYCNQCIEDQKIHCNKCKQVKDNVSFKIDEDKTFGSYENKIKTYYEFTCEDCKQDVKCRPIVIAFVMFAAFCSIHLMLC